MPMLDKVSCKAHISLTYLLGFFLLNFFFAHIGDICHGHGDHGVIHLPCQVVGRGCQILGVKELVDARGLST